MNEKKLIISGKGLEGSLRGAQDGICFLGTGEKKDVRKIKCKIQSETGEIPK